MPIIPTNAKDADSKRESMNQQSGREIEKPENGGFDKIGRVVNKHGYLTNENGDLIDKHNRKKIDMRLLDEDNNIMKLYNLEARRYDIRDLLGEFDRDEKGNIIILKDPNEKFVDKQGKRVNKKGYMADDEGNIIDNEQNLIFRK